MIDVNDEVRQIIIDACVATDNGDSTASTAADRAMERLSETGLITGPEFGGDWYEYTALQGSSAADVYLIGLA